MSFPPPFTRTGLAAPVQALLGSAIDYAGLFPPAKRSMADAVAHYAGCLRGTHADALGRFVLPLARLAELEAEFARLPVDDACTWRLSVLAGPDPAADAAVIRDFNARQAAARIVAVETKAASPRDVESVTAALPTTVEVWVEGPTTGDVEAMIKAIKATGHGAKIRMGGVTPEAFPKPADVVRFLLACHHAQVVCKATAGLHHPLSGDYSLTYEADSPMGTMFGFLNIFLTAALVQAGGSPERALELLGDGEPAHFELLPDEIVWGGVRVNSNQLTRMRATLCRSFGSCSFTEPIAGLQALFWL